MLHPSSSAAEPLPGDPSRTYGTNFHGNGWDLFAIGLQCGLLTMLTLGIYAPWARARQVQYMTDNGEFAETQFHYKGTGREILRGYFIGLLFLAVAYIGFILLTEQAASDTSNWLLLLGWTALCVWLGHYAYYRTRRYRLSRTTWREIRFRLTGEAAPFATRSCGNLMLAILTLGILWPWYLHSVQHYVYNRLHFGNLSFQYTGNRGEYTRLWLRGLLLTVLTFGIHFFWWRPRMYTYFVTHLGIQASRFRTRIEAQDYFMLVAGNAVLILFTFGLAAPWVACRTAKFYCERLQLVGALDVDQAVQAMEDKSGGFAEGIADALDVDVDLGF